MKSVRNNGRRLLHEFFKPSKKELEKAEEGIEKIQIKDEPAGFDCDLCGHPMVHQAWSLRKLHVVTSSDCHNTKGPLPKKLVCLVQPVDKVKLSSVRQSNRVFYGCDRHPDCEFTSWDPVGRNRPKSGQFAREESTWWREASYL